MSADPAARAARFRALHQAPGIFVMPNPWDAGSAKALAALGFMALATSSGASAGLLGRRDGQVSRDEALAHARLIVQATELPVSADLEKGFGDDPDTVAQTITLAGETGLAGASIEDASGDPSRPIFDFTLAVERIAAAAEAVRRLHTPFVLTARTENFLHGRADLDDTIRRLQAFEQAGAQVLFAPGLVDLASVRAVCDAVSAPVNFMAGIKGKSFSVADLEKAGVKRVSVASSFYRAAMAALRDAATEVRDRGTFGYLDRI